jgi:hypothetical protein
MQQQRNMRKQYRFSPTLLNDFNYYLTEKGSEFDNIWITEEKLIDRINGVRSPASKAMDFGNLFESAVTTNMNVDFIEEGVVLGKVDNEDLVCSFDVYALGKKKFGKGILQQYVNYTIHLPTYDLILHGYVDHIFGGVATDIKTGSKLEYHSFKDTFQHSVYMIALRGMGVNVHRFDYWKTDFKDWILESYTLDVNDYERVIDIATQLVAFMESNKDKISKDRLNDNGYSS